MIVFLVTWCTWKQNTPSWFFWLLYEEVPEHPFIKMVQVQESRVSYESQQSYIISWSILPELLSWYIVPDSTIYWTTEIVIESKGKNNSIYEFNLYMVNEIEWLLPKSKKLKIEWDADIIIKDWYVYTHLNTIRYTHLWNSLESLSLRGLLLKRYEWTRIRWNRPRWSSYILPRRWKDRINSNMVSSHVVADLNTWRYASTSWESLTLEDTFSEDQESIKINLIDEAIQIDLQSQISDRSMYQVTLTSLSEIAWTMKWYLKTQNKRSSYKNSYTWDFLIPAWIKGKIHYQSKYQSKKKTRTILIPQEYIIWEKILSTVSK